MSNENEGGLFSCPVMCWIIGALLALATYLILSGRFEVGMIFALILALAVFVVSGALLGRLFCRGVETSTHGHTARHDQEIDATPQSIVSADSNGAMVSGIPETTNKTTSAGVAAAATTEASASKAKSAVAGAKPAAKPKAKAAAKPKAKSASAASTGAKKAAAKPAAKPKAKAAAKPAAKPKAKAAAKPTAKPKAKAAAKPAAKAATKPAAKKPAAKTATKPARKPVAKDGKPEMLKKARASGADDLKQIKGVGPKMETMLNKMGVYHFDQVSGWRAKEVKWVDENLEGFKGRVSRDGWVKQAKILAKGGKTEFSKKVAKGGVYAKNKK